MFGKIFKGCSISGKMVTIKRVDSRSPCFLIKDMNREISTLKEIHHDNIVRFVESFQIKNIHYLILEFIDGVDLIAFMESRDFRPLEEILVRNIFLQLMTAIAYCHSMDIAHRDIKLDNIIIDNYAKIKLIDFGLCLPKASSKLAKRFVGSRKYCAPEILRGRPYDAKAADIYSSGVTLYTLLSGYFPFNCSQRNLQQMGYYVPMIFPSPVSSTAQDILLQMTEEESCRPSAENVLKHSWMHPQHPKFKRSYSFSAIQAKIRRK